MMAEVAVEQFDLLRPSIEQIISERVRPSYALQQIKGARAHAVGR